jgi:hypothetical protein
MKRIAFPLAMLGTAFAFIVSAAPAQAQATRTWVSGVGDDVNPCSRTAPCKTFAGAISKTAAFGEINCIDPGGFGTVTITKSITIDCTGTFGSILASGTNGVNIPTAGILVVLKGLSINGANTGLIGVNMSVGANLLMEDVTVQGFRAGGATGVQIKPTGGTQAHLTMNRVTLTNNNTGLSVDSTSATIAILASVHNSVAAGNAGAGIQGVSTAQEVKLTVDNSAALNNGTGMSSSGTLTSMIIGGNTVATNGTGLSVVSSGKIFTYKTNNVNGNTTDVSGALQPVIPQT